MTDCKPVLPPMEGTLTKTSDKEIKPDSEYMKLVGSLLYAALVTRQKLHLRCNRWGNTCKDPMKNIGLLQSVY
jgi:hypothetical protein